MNGFRTSFLANLNLNCEYGIETNGPFLFFSVAITCKDYSFFLKGFLECIIPIILLLYKLKNAWHSTVFRDREFKPYESCIIFRKPEATLKAKLNCSLKTMLIVLNELTLSSQIVTHSRNHKSNTALYQTRGKASVLPFGKRYSDEKYARGNLSE